MKTRGRLLGLLGCLALVAGGCVTEEPARSGRTPPPNPKAASQLPSGPVASPSLSAQRSTARLRLQIRPLGSVPYDGQVLPLVSPDARFLATQSGMAPSWEILLAAPGERSVPSSRPLVYDITQQPMVEVSPSQPLPQGVILGRSCDTAGYLVECPRPDGSRWIGKADWITGNIGWAASDTMVNAHATLTQDGSVVWSRRTVSGENARFDLMVKSSGGVTRLSDPDWSFMFPTVGDDPGLIFAFAVGRNSMDLIAVRLDTQNGPPRFGAVVSRRVFARQADVALAYQAIASAQTPPPTPAKPPVGLVFYNPSVGRMSEWEAKSGAVALLPEESVAAVRSSLLEEGGFFVTTAKGLVFAPDLVGPAIKADGTPNTRPLPAPLFDVPNVARATLNPEAPIIMVGPLRDAAAPRLAVIAATAAPAEPKSPSSQSTPK
jgi:hypothetical protein